MSRSQILFEICQSTLADEFAPMGAMYQDKADAERALKELKPHYPTAFIARVIYTRMEEPNTRPPLRAV